uniref:F-box domain-containing protein n=1 Tax=Oryza glumipatula TaxID=40148 RepID=A0A0E0A0K2_9ORYZ
MTTAFLESGKDGGQDGLSALPDDVIVGGLGLRDVVRASVLSRRLDNDVADFMPYDHGDSSSSDDRHRIMSAYADATRWLLAPSAERAIKSVSLSFLIAEPYLLHAVARAVDDLLLNGSNSSLESLEMDMWTDWVAAGAATLEQRRLFGQRFQSLFDAYPAQFRCLHMDQFHGPPAKKRSSQQTRGLINRT